MGQLRVARHHCGVMVERQHRNKELRPTVVALIYREVDGQNQVLLVRGTHSPYPLQLPQGGVELGESIDDAFFREVFEELALPKEAFSPPEYVGYKVSLKPQQKNHEMYKRGSLYFCFAAKLVKDLPVVLNEENLNYCWVPFYEARRMFTEEGRKPASIRSHQFLVKFQHRNLF